MNKLQIEEGIENWFSRACGGFKKEEQKDSTEEDDGDERYIFSVERQRKIKNTFGVILTQANPSDEKERDGEKKNMICLLFRVDLDHQGRCK